MSVSVYAPPSVGNVSVGFDSLGLALQPIAGQQVGDVVTVSAAHHDQWHVKGPWAHALPTDPKENAIHDVHQRFNQALKAKGMTPKPAKVVLDKRLPIGSGLGSSASSVVACAVALNLFHQQALSDEDLLSVMADAEAKISGGYHLDNVAPAFTGGLQLMTPFADQPFVVLPELLGLYWVVAYPGTQLNTQASRSVLPSELPMPLAIEWVQRTAAFVDACHRQDLQGAGALLQDVVAEPHRVQLLPGYADLKALLNDQGALAVGISGSGPTVFAVTDDLTQAQAFEKLMASEYVANERGFVHICKADVAGARVVQQPDELKGAVA